MAVDIDLHTRHGPLDEENDWIAGCVIFGWFS